MTVSVPASLLVEAGAMLRRVDWDGGLATDEAHALIARLEQAAALEGGETPRGETCDIPEIQRAWFYAGFAAGLQAVDKFGEEHDTGPEAFERLKANVAPEGDTPETQER